MTTTDDIATRLASVKARIQRAARDAGRDPGEVTLVAVSKKHGTEAIKAALDAGHLDIGENYAQELRDKAATLGIGPAVAGGPPLPRWHYIGPLQRNKVKYVVGTAVLVHAVDSEKLGLAISKRSGDRPTPILVEVNVAGEGSKHGVALSDALSLCRELHGLPGLDLRGLMCLPPMVDDPGDARQWFRTLANVAAEGRGEGLPLRELSMGMSHDFEVAIQEGATIIRVGTAIFGPRT